MRQLLLALPLCFVQIPASQAQVSVGIGIEMPGVSIGLNLPAYPQMTIVPGYPVYYAPHVSSNYFFYDGRYWVYEDDRWFASGWYNGPWQAVGREYVPSYLLRVPVRYYRRPPPQFRGWSREAPPRWDEQWGHDWAQSRHGWDQRDHHAVPAAAPLPAYQRHYAGERYPHAVEQQQSIRSSNYHYQPREAVVQEHGPRNGDPDGAHGQPQPQRGQPDSQGRGHDDKGSSQGKDHEKRND